MSKQWEPGDELKAIDLNNTGGGLAVQAQTSPNMTVLIGKGKYYLAGAIRDYAGGSSGTITAPSTNPRIDLVCIDSAGTISIVTGTEAASPSAPTYPADKLVLAEIYLKTTSTSIRNYDAGSTAGYILKDSRIITSPYGFSEYFGDGSDGAIDINSGSFSSGPITSNALTRDAHFTNLTLSGGNLDPAGYKIFVSGTLTRSSTYKIFRNGNNGSNGNNGGGANPSSGNNSVAGGGGGSALGAGSLPGGVAGATGGASGGGGGNGTGGSAGSTGGAGTGNTSCIGVASAAGSAGGAGGNGSNYGGGGGGGGGSAGTCTVPAMRPNLSTIVLGVDISGATLTQYKANGGAPGGGGGGGGGGFNTGQAQWNYGGAGGSGGGGGSDGGMIYIAARFIVLTGTGAWLESKGGTGGNGGNGGGANGATGSVGGAGGGGGGGNGGNGGTIILIYTQKTGTPTIDQSGGAGGSAGSGGSPSAGGGGGTNGTAGAAGTTGKLWEFIVY
jgi:hypothetical protein